jgi:hypothetical protein
MRLNADFVLRVGQMQRAANPLTTRFVGGVTGGSDSRGSEECSEE